MPVPVVCNEPIVALKSLRSPRIWQTILAPDIPGKLLTVQVQLNHGLVDEDKPKLDQQILGVYKSVIEKFAKLHGESTRCFLARAPESIDLVGLHVKELGAATASLACLETVFCVSPRDDKKVQISHLDDRFPAVQFDLLDGLPKARVLDWRAHAHAGRTGNTSWAATIKGALQYYVNRHKGPTGQVELEIPGLNIVVGSVLPPNVSTHCDTTLAAVSLISIMALTGEWGKIPLTDFVEWCGEAQESGQGRRGNLGAILFGMPGELTHMDWNPPRPKTHALAHGHCFVSAYTGKPTGAPPSLGIDAKVLDAVSRQLASKLQSNAAGLAGLLNGESIYEAIKESPQRERVLYALAEMQRAVRAAQTIKKGDAADFGALMNIGQAADANMVFALTPSGQIEQSYPIIHTLNNGEFDSLAEHADPLWRQSGASAVGTPETDFLCDLAMTVAGVLGTRCCEPERVIILCKYEVLTTVIERLIGGYYVPRDLPSTLLTRVFPCRGAGIVDV